MAAAGCASSPEGKKALYTGDTDCGGVLVKALPRDMVGDSSSPLNVYMAQQRPKHRPSNGLSPHKLNKQAKREQTENKTKTGINHFQTDEPGSPPHRSPGETAAKEKQPNQEKKMKTK